MEKYFSKADIQSWERFYRGNFINCMSGFKSASLIATADADGHANLAIFSNIVHLGADPALIGFVNRPREAAPHTLANIEATGVYSINLISEALVEKAHQTSAQYPAEVSEFEAVGLTPQWIDGLHCPLVKESPLKYSLALHQIIPIEANNTFFVIGTVQSVWVDEALVSADGYIALEKAGVITSLGLDGYYSTQRISRLSYAKTDKPPVSIDL